MKYISSLAFVKTKFIYKDVIGSDVYNSETSDLTTEEDDIRNWKAELTNLKEETKEVWKKAPQNKLAEDIAIQKEKEVRLVQAGDTMSSIIKGLTGKLDFGMAVVYRDKNGNEGSNIPSGKLKKQFERNQINTLAGAGYIYPGQYVWIENGKVVIGEKAPTDEEEVVAVEEEPVVQEAVSAESSQPPEVEVESDFKFTFTNIKELYSSIDVYADIYTYTSNNDNSNFFINDKIILCKDDFKYLFIKESQLKVTKMNETIYYWNKSKKYWEEFPEDRIISGLKLENGKVIESSFTNKDKKEMIKERKSNILKFLATVGGNSLDSDITIKDLVFNVTETDEDFDYQERVATYKGESINLKINWNGKIIFDFNNKIADLDLIKKIIDIKYDKKQVAEDHIRVIRDKSTVEITKKSSLAELSTYFMNYKGSDYIGKAKELLSTLEASSNRYKGGRYGELILAIYFHDGVVSSNYIKKYNDKKNLIKDRRTTFDKYGDVLGETTWEYDKNGKNTHIQVKKRDNKGNLIVSSETTRKYENNRLIQEQRKRLDKDGKLIVFYEEIKKYDKSNKTYSQTKELDKDDKLIVSNEITRKYDENNHEIKFQEKKLNNDGNLIVFYEDTCQYDENNNVIESQTKELDKDGNLIVSYIRAVDDKIDLTKYPNLKEIGVTDSNGEFKVINVPSDYNGTNYEVKDGELVKVEANVKSNH